MLSIIKILRFINIYGIKRTIYKIYGRSEWGFFRSLYLGENRTIGLIGCGQFQFATVGYYLSRSFINRFLFCYDIDENKSLKFSRFYNVTAIKNTKRSDLQTDLKTVYIASNHASHTPYAIDFLEKGLDVYCEKPISVNFNQFDSLIESINKSDGKFYAGYNRPYSEAITKLAEVVKSNIKKESLFSLNCFVSAHDIPEDHWYRNPNEGSRICGNVGHWLDLMIHMYNWRGYIPTEYEVTVVYSNKEESDDNISISITTPEGDITSIVITARTEPFEGINETINFQYDTVIAKIDDFRGMTIWDGEKIYRKKYWPKDVGHKRSIEQPFKSEKENRDLSEVIASTELMLNIAEMVKKTETRRLIVLKRSL